MYPSDYNQQPEFNMTTSGFQRSNSPVRAFRPRYSSAGSVDMDAVMPRSSASERRPTDHCSHMQCWDWILLLFLLGLPFTGGFLGAKFFNKGSYRNNLFIKPVWAPPAIVFGPVWTGVYILMGLGSFLCWKIGRQCNRNTTPALLIYAIQLILSWVWGPLFFGFQFFAPAYGVLCAIWGLSVACLFTFFQVHTTAGMLIIPYFVWITMLVPLNFVVLCSNECFAGVYNGNWTNATAHLLYDNGYY